MTASGVITGSVSARNPNLDLLRATAITMVVIYHTAQTTPAIRPITNYGEYGVDLFFVLSGWLIGGLYWRERHAFGSVQIVRFWMRRWIRTLPPYFAALLVAWLAAYALRNQAFDYAYLVFVQNYYHYIPFFQVSWSLCVEEHFYLLLPLLLAFHRGKVNPVWFILPLIVPVLSRLAVSGEEYSLYFKTATHLRMDGLILGVWLSYLAVEYPHRFETLIRSSPWAVLIAAFVLTGLVLAGGLVKFLLWGTVSAVFFSALLVVAVSRTETKGLTASIAAPIALASYSIYLTHSWAITATLKLVDEFPVFSVAYFPIAFLLVAGLGAVFYFGIEHLSIRLRDFYWPRRASDAGSIPGRGTPAEGMIERYEAAP